MISCSRRCGSRDMSRCPQSCCWSRPYASAWEHGRSRGWPASTARTTSCGTTITLPWHDVGDVLPIYGTQPLATRGRHPIPPGHRDRHVRGIRVRGWSASAASDDDVGYLVLTPLADVRPPPSWSCAGSSRRAACTAGVTAPAPPSGTHTIVGRVMPAETTSDKAAQLPAGQINSINASEQSSRLGERVYDGYVELSAGQPGTQGLVAIPEPDLSNPAGGAVEPQHLAYVIQWYLFAALALAAPIVMARAERRRVSAELDDEAPRSRRRTPKRPGSLTATDAPRTDGWRPRLPCH